jgi:hypothetical protein
MRKATPTAPASNKSGAPQSLDMHAAASQPRRWQTRLTLHYTPADLLTTPRRARVSDSQNSAAPRALPRLSLCRNSYCRP